MGYVRLERSVISQYQADIETTARVISEALIATGVGVLVAVPAILLFKYFEQIVASLVSDMDNAINEIEARFGRNQRADYGQKQLALE